MNKVSLVNNDYNKPTSYEISTSKEHFTHGILSAIGCIVNSLDEAQELIDLIKNTNYTDYEAIVLERNGISIIVYTCEPYVREPQLLRDFQN